MNQQILGDKKRVRYDEGLVDVVNKKYEKEIVKPEEEVIDLGKKTVASGRVVLDKYPMSDGISAPFLHDLPGFYSRFDANGRIMISLPDVYQAAKYGDEELISSLRKDCEESAIITDTIRVVSLAQEDIIIHHGQNNKLVTSICKPVYVPDMNQWTLDTALNLKIGLDYIKAIFNTNDDAEDIKKVLERLSNRDSEKIIVSTKKRYEINTYCHLVLFYQRDVLRNMDRFYISEKSQCETFSGRSRGVTYVN